MWLKGGGDASLPASQGWIPKSVMVQENCTVPEDPKFAGMNQVRRLGGEMIGGEERTERERERTWEEGARRDTSIWLNLSMEWMRLP